MMSDHRFPRLYVEQAEPPQIEVSWRFVGQRWPFGPCTVSQQFCLNGEYGEKYLLLLVDWHGQDAEWLAREMLWKAKCRNDGDIPKLFVAEVLAKMSSDSWELSSFEVKAWGAKHDVPEVQRAPPPSFEDEVRDTLHRLGMLDEDEMGQGGQ